jgi:hypothetical protein
MLLLLELRRQAYKNPITASIITSSRKLAEHSLLFGEFFYILIEVVHIRYYGLSA